MITQIDVRDVALRLGHGKPDLVTRPTGRAVRSSIESALGALAGGTVVVLDFTDVRIIDCSCADEIVAKLVEASIGAAVFLLKGLHDDQIADIEHVLRPRHLALTAEGSGMLRIHSVT